eukprot:COSAG06_NODE_1744_length_8496_cov_3.831130_3_plen_68_part_00
MSCKAVGSDDLRAQKLEKAVPAFIRALASFPICAPVANHRLLLKDIAVEILRMNYAHIGHTRCIRSQ